MAQILGRKEPEMAEFNPSDHTAEEVKDELEGASEDEKRKIAAAESSGKARKTVLEAAGVDPDVRMDATGRVLHPWEVSPEAPVEQEQPAEN